MLIRKFYDADMRDTCGSTKPLVSGSVFLPTMKLRWSKEVFYDGSIGEYCRKLQQCYIDETGAEHWLEVEVEGKNIAV